MTSTTGLNGRLPLERGSWVDNWEDKDFQSKLYQIQQNLFGKSSSNNIDNETDTQLSPEQLRITANLKPSVRAYIRAMFVHHIDTVTDILNPSLQLEL